MQPERQPEGEPERRFREVPPEGNVPPRGEMPAERRMRPVEEHPGEERRYMPEAGLFRRDRMRSGPVVAGMLSALGTLVVLNLLGQVFGLRLISPATFGIVALNTGAGVWAFVAFLVALFVGGWVTARTLAFGALRPAMLNAGIMWALLVAVGVFLSALGLTVFGPVLSGFTFLRLGGPVFGSTLALWAFLSLVIGFGAAVLGAWVGARHYEYERPSEPR